MILPEPHNNPVKETRSVLSSPLQSPKASELREKYLKPTFSALRSVSASASAHWAPRLLNCSGNCECQGRRCLFVRSVSGRSVLHYITAKAYERRELWCHQPKRPWILHYKTDMLMLKGNTQHAHQKGMFSFHCNGN